MSFSQIAFDFDDVPQQPAAPLKKKTVPPKPVLPVAAVIPGPAPTTQKSTRGRKSIKELSATVDLVEVPEDEVLYQKAYYPIGQVAAMFKVNQSLLRLWENEFDVLRPKKNGKGDRLFRPEDIKNLQIIYHLTREKKYTLEGAKDYFKNNKKAQERFELIQALKKVRSFLNEVKANL
jgi:DNA-binding transcriptional MerR regulator